MNIDNIIKKCLDKHIQRNILTEYSSDQRLPFDDDYFKNKNYLEQYTDWIEDFGKYGELSSSKLNFWDEIKNAIKLIIDKKIKNHKGLTFENNFNEIFDNLKDIIGNNINFNNKGNIYVERRVKINHTSDSYDSSDKYGNDPKLLYNSLVKNYNNNVGGCWCYKTNGSDTYCTFENGDTITFKGFIRTDDIDYIKTVLLNFHYPKEHEIRVKPNAKVELFEVVFDCKYKIPLKGNLIVNSTYFGNNGKYNGEYAKVDDGFGGFSLIDRNSQIQNVSNFIKNKINNNIPIDKIFDNIKQINQVFKCGVLFNQMYLIDYNDNVIGNGSLYFDDISNLNHNYVAALLKNKYAIIAPNGDLIGDGKLWFDKIFLDDRYFKVELNNHYSLVNHKGKLTNNGDIWFDWIEDFNENFVKVLIKNKYSLVNINNNKLILDGKIWFDEIGNLFDGLAKVKLDNKYSFINNEGKLIFDSNLWFDKAEFLGDELGGMIEKNGQRYLFDKNMNFYDYKTKQQIQNPFNKNNESFDKYINHIIYECFEKLINKKN